jgi:thioester reductase-like protein
MIPATFSWLAELPLNANGKIDRRALPAPGPRSAPRSGEASEPPRTALEARLAALFAEVLGVAAVGRNANFFDLGGHSVAAIRLLGRLKDALGVDLPPRRFFEAQSVADLATVVEELLQGGGSGADLATDIVLDPIISGQGCQGSRAAVESPAAVLLTGATGFVGAFLLHELLQRTRARIYCLVRAGSPEAAGERLRRSLESYELWDESAAARLVPLAGDLAFPRFGLSAERFAALGSELDAIYHNGALVNFAYPYAALKRANVQGTEEALRLAAQGRTKPLHFVSTVSVFDSAVFAGRPRVDETDDPAESAGLPDGYVQSKWVGERLVRLAGERGLPVAIYRLGRVSWHSRTGVWTDTDFVHRMLRSCVQLGSAPEIDRHLPLVPIDFVSASLVALSLRPGSLGRSFHLTNPRPVPWERLVQALHRSGYPLRRLPFPRWQEELMAGVRRSAEIPLYAMAALSREAMAPAEAEAYRERLERKTPVVDTPHTLAALAGCGIDLPPIGPELMDSYLSFALRRGLLPAPPGHLAAPQGEQAAGG